MTRLSYLAKKLRDVADMMTIIGAIGIIMTDEDTNRSLELTKDEVNEMAGNLESLERVVRYTQAKVQQWNDEKL